MNKVLKINCDDIVMSNEDLCEVVSSHMDNLSEEAVLDMVTRLVKRAMTEEPEALRNASPVTKTLYIAKGAYEYGFLAATYQMNEAIKDLCKEADLQNA